MPKRKTMDDFAQCRVRVADLLIEGIKEAAAEGNAEQAGLLQLALMEIDRLRQYDETLH
jgi:hypothetical protein